jgi:hypothetical protein
MTSPVDIIFPVHDAEMDLDVYNLCALLVVWSSSKLLKTFFFFSLLQTQTAIDHLDSVYPDLARIVHFILSVCLGCDQHTYSICWTSLLLPYVTWTLIASVWFYSCSQYYCFIIRYTWGELKYGVDCTYLVFTTESKKNCTNVGV